MNRGSELPRLHLVTDDRVIGRERFVERATELLSAGGGRVALHLRARAASGRHLHGLATELVDVASRSDSVVIMNDRVDVAMATGAAGVQLREDSLPLTDARRLLGSTRLVGVSAHDASSASRALSAGADFVLAGTLFPSASHPGEAVSGAEWLGKICPAPARVIGIGGITVERVGSVLGAGAFGVAVITAVWDAERPREALLRFIQVLYGRK